jgi:hypothetical protein
LIGRALMRWNVVVVNMVVKLVRTASNHNSSMAIDLDILGGGEGEVSGL